MTLPTVATQAGAEHFLFEELPKSPKTLFKHGKGIERSRIFFELLGNPQNELAAIHVAATSGKGSISHILDALLRAHGKTTGLHVSPHVYDYRERMMVNGEFISEQTLCGALNNLFPTIEKMDASEAGRPTYFEVSNALAFSIFANAKVDYSVIETGLGGLNDSTNTIDRRDKLALLGQIGEDHVDILASVDQLVDAAQQQLIPEWFTQLPTILERIAVQKAGIMPFNGTAIALKQRPEINTIFEQMAEFRNTNLMWITRHELKDMTFNLPGDFQLDNLGLAMAALELVAARDGWEVQEEFVRQALLNVTLPGRFEVRELRDKTIVLDGAHNPQKMAGLVQAFRHRFANQKATVIMAIGQTKDVDETLQELSPIADTIICTHFFTAKQDFKSASITPNQLAERAKVATKAKIKVAISQQDALDQAFASDSDIILITGSFYFLGEINTLVV